MLQERFCGAKSAVIVLDSAAQCLIQLFCSFFSQIRHCAALFLTCLLQARGSGSLLPCWPTSAISYSTSKFKANTNLTSVFVLSFAVCQLHGTTNATTRSIHRSTTSSFLIIFIFLYSLVLPIELYYAHNKNAFPVCGPTHQSHLRNSSKLTSGSTKLFQKKCIER